MRKSALVLGALTLMIGLQTSAHAGVLVGQCVEFSSCYNSTTAWSDTVSGAELSALGLGSTQDFIAQQTSQYVIRLGQTTADFQTSTGLVEETLGEFSGNGSYPDPGPYETDVVGTFVIPVNATSLFISGTFGNSAVSSSAGTNLYFGAIPSVPEPATWALMLAGFGVIGLSVRRRQQLSVTYC